MCTCLLKGVVRPNCQGGGGARLGKCQGQVHACAHGDVRGGCAPLRNRKVLEFLYRIRAIWWILLGKILVIINVHISIKTTPFFPLLSLFHFLSLFFFSCLSFFFFFLSLFILYLFSFPFSFSLPLPSFPPFSFPSFPFLSCPPFRFFPLPRFLESRGQSAPLPAPPPHWLRPCVCCERHRIKNSKKFVLCSEEYARGSVSKKIETI